MPSEIVSLDDDHDRKDAGEYVLWLHLREIQSKRSRDFEATASFSLFIPTLQNQNQNRSNGFEVVTLNSPNSTWMGHVKKIFELEKAWNNAKWLNADWHPRPRSRHPCHVHTY